MELQLEKKKEVLIAKPFGELDLHTVPFVKGRLEWELSSNPHINTLILDFQRLNFIDSTGIGLILGRIRKLKGRGGKMVVTGLTGHMRKVLTMAGVLGLVTERTTIGKALQDENISPDGR